MLGPNATELSDDSFQPATELSVAVSRSSCASGRRCLLPADQNCEGDGEEDSIDVDRWRRACECSRVCRRALCLQSLPAGKLCRSATQTSTPHTCTPNNSAPRLSEG